MQKCDYCGIITKYKVDHCPYCGATSYTEIDAMDGKPYEITDLSKIKFKNIPKPKEAKSTQNIVSMVLLSLLLCGFTAGVIFLSLGSLVGIITGQAQPSEYLSLIAINASLIITLILGVVTFIKTKNGGLSQIEELPKYSLKALWIPFVLGIFGNGFNDFFDSLLIIVALMIVLFAIVYISYWFANAYVKYKNSKRALEKYNSLIKNGMLIKNVKYTLCPTSAPHLNKLKVDYTTSNGVALNLVSQKMVVGTPDDKDVDILVDKTDFGNYYIDLEIY